VQHTTLERGELNMTTDPFATRREDWATWLLVPVGLVTVLGAFAALIVAGISLADTFVTGADAVEMARDRGVAAATTGWASPLALVGVATVFSGIVVALARLRLSIGGRRDALVSALPRIVNPSHSSPRSEI
jgi:hypothetical protein